MTRFKEIAGYEGFYEVSDQGTVKSLDRMVKTINKREYLRKGKIMNKCVDGLGYEIVGLTINSKTISKKVHRLVGETFLPNPENKPCINHIDGNKTNNKVTNLEWCSYSENSKHAYKNGLTNPKYPVLEGEKNGRALLTEQQVKDIRSKYIPYKKSVKDLSKEYNVSQSCITHILNNTSWKENTR